MTDIVQKIREAVEKLKSQLLRGACSSQVAMETRCKEEAYNEVLAILDTMQEEPTSVWHNMDEVPIKGEVIVVQTKDTFYGLSIQKGGTTYKNKNKDRYVKWAYASDLLNLSNVQRTVKDWKEPVSKDYRERYKNIAQSDAFKSAYQNKSLGEVMSIEGEEPISEDKIEKKFKAGDVVMYISSHSAYSGLYLLGNSNDLHIGYSNADEPYNIALRNCTIASEDERSQFMRELANNGYRWDKKTKRIEKIEPVSEELEEKIAMWMKEHFDRDMSRYSGCYLTTNSLLEYARHFANWQKKQDQETIELAEDHAMLAGMNKMKEQMMAKAIDAELYSDGMLTPLIKVNDKEKISGIKFGDKVKIIIIKNA